MTVGTHQQGFPRLLGALSHLPAPDQLIVQYGNGQAPARSFRARPFMPFEEMVRYFDEAEAVITHAGVGSILCARRAGHLPVVVPRLRQLGEHVDDHQVELTEALAELGAVQPVWNVAELGQALAAATRYNRQRPASPETPPSALHEAVRKELESAPGGWRPLSRRRGQR